MNDSAPGWRCGNTRPASRTGIVAVFNPYGLREPDEDYDLFRGKGRVELSMYSGKLSKHTRGGVIGEWSLVDEMEKQIKELEV